MAQSSPSPTASLASSSDREQQQGYDKGKDTMMDLELHEGVLAERTDGHNGDDRREELEDEEEEELASSAAEESISSSLPAAVSSGAEAVALLLLRAGASCSIQNRYAVPCC
jgi:hypothetical protein